MTNQSISNYDIWRHWEHSVTYQSERDDPHEMFSKEQKIQGARLDPNPTLPTLNSILFIYLVI